MLAEILSGIEGLDLAVTLRGSTWLYPLVNTGHIVGVALLFGAIVPLDLRYIGFWGRIPLDHVTRLLVPVAVVGLVLAVSCGTMLFSARASEYAMSPFFRLKMVLLALGLVNSALFLFWQRQAVNKGTVIPKISRVLFGALSLTLWTSVVLLGRLVGYF